MFLVKDFRSIIISKQFRLLESRQLPQLKLKSTQARYKQQYWEFLRSNWTVRSRDKKFECWPNVLLLTLILSQFYGIKPNRFYHWITIKITFRAWVQSAVRWFAVAWWKSPKATESISASRVSVLLVNNIIRLDVGVKVISIYVRLYKRTWWNRLSAVNWSFRYNMAFYITVRSRSNLHIISSVDANLSLALYKCDWVMLQGFKEIRSWYCYCQAQLWFRVFDVKNL